MTNQTKNFSSEVRAKLETKALIELEILLNSLITSPKSSSANGHRLERMEAMLEKLGHPELAYRTVHVGGTSGKGTVSTMIAAILTCHGLSTGLHVSPYVQVLTETWQLNGQYILPSKVLEVARRVVAAGAFVGAETNYGIPNYFDTKVAIAFQLFIEAQVDVAVIEVGLGGAQDATNVLRDGVKVITNVSLDHTEILGDTVEAIGTEKIGILKKESTLVSGVTQPTVKAIFHDKASSLKARTLLLDDDIPVIINPERTVMSLEIEGKQRNVAVCPDWPEFQYRNAALACIAALQVAPDLSDEELGVGIDSAHLPGRLEKLHDSSGLDIIIDGAHNPDKMAGTVSFLKDQYPERQLVGVIALKAGKDIEGVVAELMGILSAVVITTFEAGPRMPADPYLLADSFKARGFEGHVEVDVSPEAALEKARSLCGSDGVIVITGSLYLAGRLRRTWSADDEQLLRGRSFMFPNDSAI